MSNHWNPTPNNRRNHGGNEIGYVPHSRNYTNKGNTIKFYTRVIKKNGKWGPDPAFKTANFVRPANGKNFLKVANLRGLKNFIKVANLYGGHVPIKTEHKWSKVHIERRRRNRGVPYNEGVGLRPNIS